MWKLWFSRLVVSLSLLPTLQDLYAEEPTPLLDVSSGKIESHTLVRPANAVDLVHDDTIKHIAYSADGKVIATLSGFSSKFTLWEVVSGKRLRSVDVPNQLTHERFVSFSPDFALLAIDRWHDKSVALFDVSKSTIAKVFPYGKRYNSLESCWFSPDGKHVAVWNELGATAIWNLESGQIRCTLPYEDQAELRKSNHGVAFSPDGKVIAAICADGSIKFCDSVTGKMKSQIQNKWVPNRITFSPNGSRIAVSCMGWLRVWNWETNEELLTLNTGMSNPFGDGVTALTSEVAFTPDGNTLVATSPYGSVRIWSLEPLDRLPYTYIVHPEHTFAIAISPKGKSLATSGSDRTVKVWNLIIPRAADDPTNPAIEE